jgi:hypothetical protein
MNGQIGTQFFTCRELSVRIARDHMDIVTSFPQLNAQVMDDPSGPTNGVREENISKH